MISGRQESAAGRKEKSTESKNIRGWRHRQDPEMQQVRTLPQTEPARGATPRWQASALLHCHTSVSSSVKQA